MMLFFFLFGLSLAAPSDGQETFICPMFWNSFNGSCYNYVATGMTWVDAEKHCVSKGANLVSIHSLEEDNFVKMLIRNFDPAQGPKWIGLFDAQRNGTFFWSDRSTLIFTSWNEGEPNNIGGAEHCVQTNWTTAKKWNDAPCTYKYAFVCKAQPA